MKAVLSDLLRIALCLLVYSSKPGGVSQWGWVPIERERETDTVDEVKWGDHLCLVATIYLKTWTYRYRFNVPRVMI
jgi:hypothetical protein